MAMTVSDLIIIKGSKFFFKTNGTQFFVRGVDFNANPDSLADYGTFGDELLCMHSIPLLKAAGINLITISDIDLTYDPTPCMNLFSVAGIYVLVYLESAVASFDALPWWTTDKYTSYTAIVDVFAPYNNVLGFVVADRILIGGQYTRLDAFVKAATRDMKAYIKARGYRRIPFGYSTLYDPDQPSLFPTAAQYLSCGNSTEVSIDFWAANLLNFLVSFADFYGSGYGCELASKSVTFNNNTYERSFAEVEILYGTNMSEVFSGRIVWTWIGGMVNFGGIITYVGELQNLTLTPDYTSLSQRLAVATPTTVLDAAYNPSSTRVANCPTFDTVWETTADILPRTPNSDLCSCMMDSLSCSVLSSMPQDQVSSLQSELCGTNSTICRGTMANATTGEYGDYSNCAPFQQLSWEINLMYEARGTPENTSACTNASVYARYSVPSPLTSACMVYVDDAGPLGDGVMSPATSASPPSSSSNPSSPKSSGSGSSGSNFGAGAVAGVVVGAVALLVLAGAGLFFWRRRRDVKYKKAAMSAREIDAAGLQVQEHRLEPELKPELGNDQRFEMETDVNTTELPDVPLPDRETIYEAPDSSISPVSPDLSDSGQEGYQHLSNLGWT